MRHIIKKPLVSEKSNSLQQDRIWTFLVELKATKHEIRLEVEKFFKVKVIKVRTLVCRSRSRRHRRGNSDPDYWKKAYVKLAEGNKITLLENS